MLFDLSQEILVSQYTEKSKSNDRNFHFTVGFVGLVLERGRRE